MGFNTATYLNAKRHFEHVAVRQKITLGELKEPAQKLFFRSEQSTVDRFQQSESLSDQATLADLNKALDKQKSANRRKMLGGVLKTAGAVAIGLALGAVGVPAAGAWIAGGVASMPGVSELKSGLRANAELSYDQRLLNNLADQVLNADSAATPAALG